MDRKLAEMEKKETEESNPTIGAEKWKKQRKKPRKLRSPKGGERRRREQPKRRGDLRETSSEREGGKGLRQRRRFRYAAEGTKYLKKDADGDGQH